MNLRHCCWLAALSLAAFAGPNPASAEPSSLERELVRQAPKVIRYCKDKGYQNVGVLKFLVSSNDKELSDNVGPLNMLLAERLEVALVLANDARQPVGIVENASAVAQRTRGASHRSRDGRLRLFEARYPLAWGKEQVQPDAFVTGTAGLSSDRRTLTVSLMAFGKDDKKLSQVGEDFEAAVRGDQMAEMGESFVLRGAFDEFEVATKVREEKAPHPASDGAAPMTLKVIYDGKEQPVEVRGGKAFVAEPREGQKVELVLKRDGSRERYGAVLKVNGESTIEKQRLPDLHCRRWIRDPGDGPLTVRGYQVDDRTVERFRVLSVVESQEREVNYGADVGTITLTVFRERTGKAPKPDTSDEGAATAAVGRAAKPAEKPKNYHALKASLLEESDRGLIGEGAKEPGEVKRVKFTPDPTPVMVLTLVYYRR